LDKQTEKRTGGYLRGFVIWVIGGWPTDE